MDMWMSKGSATTNQVELMEGANSLAGNDVVLPPELMWSPLETLIPPFFLPPLLPFPLLLPAPGSWGWLWCTATILGLLPWGETPGMWGNIFVTFPTALVRPSLNTILAPGRRYSGFLMNLKRQVALSPVRRCSLFMDTMEAVCLELPQWTVQNRVRLSVEHNNSFTSNCNQTD